MLKKRLSSKKLIALLAAAAMGVSALAGCGSSSTTSTSEDTSSAEEETEETAAEAEETEEAAEETEEAAAEEEAEEDDADKITDLVMWQLSSKEVTTFQFLYDGGQANSILATGYDKWLISDPVTAEAQCRLAESYESSDDGTVWTFYLRDDATWVDYQGNYKADLVVEDFLTGAEYLLNFWKNDGNNTGDLISLIEGAGDYYEYTKSLDQAEAQALTWRDDFSDMVGITADTDANSVTYQCIEPTAYFWSFATGLWTAPLAEGAIEEVGVENYNAVNYDERWYSGPYLMSSYNAGSEKVLVKNESYWDTEIDRFDTITIKMIESTELGYQLYQNGEIDQIDLTDSTLSSILDNPDNEYYDYVVEKYDKEAVTCLLFNFAKNNEDGTEDVNWNTAVANENFRLSIYWGLDLTSLLTNSNPISPYASAGYNFTHAQTCSTSDGTDYQDLVLAALGITPSDDEYMRYDADAAAEYKEKAIEELTEAGVTFPIELDYYVSGEDQTSLDQANIIKGIFDTCLGTDYINFTIKSYVSSASTEVLTPSLHSIYLSSWKADFADPLNTMGQFVLDDEDASYAVKYQNSNNATDETLVAELQEFTDMFYEAAAVSSDMDTRYELFAESEAYYIEHALMVPLYKNKSWQLTRINDYSKQDKYYCGWETNVNGYTAEDYAAFKAEALGG